MRSKAFLPEEGGTAQAVTEGAARKQVHIISYSNSSRLFGYFLRLRVRYAVRTSFSALPLGELAFAQQMTERATR